LSGEEALLDCAATLGAELSHAFLPSRTRLPHASINLASLQASAHVPAGGCAADSRITLAEAGTLRLEFDGLAAALGVDALPAVRQLQLAAATECSRHGGLAPSQLLVVETGAWAPEDRTVTLGGGADSFYEYLLKSWMLGSRADYSMLKARVGWLLRWLLRRALTPNLTRRTTTRCTA
jgi:mannosyl-oligosaccharide alpha-1,2-mannosidase